MLPINLNRSNRRPYPSVLLNIWFLRVEAEEIKASVGNRVPLLQYWPDRSISSRDRKVLQKTQYSIPFSSQGCKPGLVPLKPGGVIMFSAFFFLLNEGTMLSFPYERADLSVQAPMTPALQRFFEGSQNQSARD